MGNDNIFFNVSDDNALDESVLKEVSGGKMQTESLLMDEDAKKKTSFANTLYSGGKMKAENLLKRNEPDKKADKKADPFDALNGPTLC